MDRRGPFKGGVVEIILCVGDMQLTGTAETVQKACQDGKLIPDEAVKNLIQLGMSSSSGGYYDKARKLKVRFRGSGYLDIVHKKAGDIILMRRKMAEQLFLAGWTNLGYYADGFVVDRWGYKPR